MNKIPGQPHRSAYVLDLHKALANGEVVVASDVNPLHDQAKADLEKYLAIHKEPNLFVKFFKKLAHILGWIIRLFLPSFLFGHPSIWDNMYTLRKNPQFKPMRQMLLSWLIFAVVVSGSGVYGYLYANKAEATSWYNASWGYRQKITIDATKVQTNDQTSFPVLINTTSATWKSVLNSGHVGLASGLDILFTSNDGTTLLDYELEKYTASTGEVIAWVRIPTLSHTTNTDIYMYYGNASATDHSNRTGVWDSNFKAVYHMGDAGTSSVADSTTNARTGTKNGTVSFGQTGQIGSATSYITDGYIETSYVLPTTDFTIGAWAKSSATGFSNRLMGNANSATGANGADIIWGATGASNIFSVIRGGTGSSDINAATSSSVTTGWHYIVLTVKNGVGTVLYQNGASIGSNAGISIASVLPFRIGRDGNGSDAFNGTVDEVHVSSVARGVDWIKTEYNNQSSPSTFYSVAAEERANQAPNTPTNSAPTNAATRQSLTPTLSASAFSDPDVGNTQAAAQWQVTTTSGNYTSPVYDSGTDATHLTSISVPSSTLSNATTYYWHVRYQDSGSPGLWSSYSSEFSFTTARLPATPTNTSPSNGILGQTFTPTLTASAFSSGDGAATHRASQWLIRSVSDASYASPVYDSGTDTSHLTSIAVPSGNLSNNTTYYWKVRYQDDQSNWGAYSSEFALSTGITPLTVVSVGATEYTAGETARLTIQATDSVGAVINSATVTINIYSPSGVALVSSGSMTYLTSSNGLYYYNYTVPSTIGVYTYDVSASYSGSTSHAAHTFHVSQMGADITSIKSDVGGLVTSVAAIKAKTDTIDWANVTAIKTKTDTIAWGDITGVVSSVAAIKAKTDTIDWANVTAIKTKTDTIDWGDITGVVSSVAAIKAKTDTIDWANVTAIKTATDTIDWGDVTGLVTTAGDIKTKTDDIDWTDIVSIKTATDTIDWADVTGIATVAAAVQAKTDTIDWANVTAIKTATDTIDWGDVTGIATVSAAVQAKTDTIDWSHVTAIKTATDTIDWADVTGIAVTVAAEATAAATERAAQSAERTAAAAERTATAAELAAQSAQLTAVQRQSVAGLLNTETTVKSGNTVSIRYRAETGLTGSGAPKLNVYDATNTLRVTNATMIENGSTGIYEYEVTFLSGWGTGSFTVRVAETTNSTRDSMQLFIGASDIQSIGTAVTSASANLDVLLGAFIVSQSSVDDATPSTTSFTTTLPNSTNNFYKNAVLTFTSGSLKGQSRRVSAYNGTTKVVTLDPALTSAPSDTDQFTVVAQNVHIEETANAIATTVSDTNTKVTDIQTRVSDVQTKVTAIQSTLAGVDTKLDTLATSVNAIRTSQQSNYMVNLSSPSQIEAGGDYRAKLEIADYQASAADADSIPTITIFDSARSTIVSSDTMTRNAVGQYEYVHALPDGTTGGLWESVVTVVVGGSTQTRTNYWTVTGSPAQVLINSMTSLTVPNIGAGVTITNEGSTDYEYHYQWCIVRAQSDTCSGGSAVASGSAAKLIRAGENFTPTLSLNVPTPGSYWFKLIVTFGTQSSAASLNFTAVGASNTTTSTTAGSGGDPILPNTTSLETLRAMLETNAVKMNKLLATVGTLDPKASGFQSLLAVNVGNTQSIKDVQNKLADLKAISATLHQLSDQKSVNPIVQTYMKFNSVEIHFLVTNPASKTQTVQFKAFLPDEVKPEYIVNSDGLKVDYDPEAKTYYVSADISLGAGQSIVKKVEMKDIWMFTPEQLSGINSQATNIVTSLADTQFGAQATLLQNDLVEKISRISADQAVSYDSPQNHIMVYRDNQKLFAQVETDLSKLKDLLVQSGASRGLIGSVGGIQTFATWGIILAVIFGFGIMGTIMYLMWRNQMIMTSMMMGMHPTDIQETFLKTQRGRRVRRQVAG